MRFPGPRSMRRERRRSRCFSRQRQGMVLWAAPDWTLKLPRCGQCGPAGQRCPANHACAVASCGNIRMLCTSGTPSRWALPGALQDIPGPCQTRARFQRGPGLDDSDCFMPVCVPVRRGIRVFVGRTGYFSAPLADTVGQGTNDTPAAIPEYVDSDGHPLGNPVGRLRRRGSFARPVASEYARLVSGPVIVAPAGRHQPVIVAPAGRLRLVNEPATVGSAGRHRAASASGQPSA